MNVRFVVLAAALLSGGCEQIKSLKNIHELEGKVDELTKQMAELKGSGAGPGSGSGAGSAEAKKEGKDAKPAPAAKPEEKPDAKADDKKVEAKAEDKPDAKPEAKAEDKPDAKPEAKPDAKVESKAEDKPDAKPAGAKDDTAEAKADDKPAENAPKPVPAMGPADASGKTATADPPPPPGAGITSDPAFDKLLNVVAENTAKARPNVPGAPRWDYGKAGSAGWADLDPTWRACGAGKAQSPIDIEPRASAAKPITFHYQPGAATVMDTGRTLQVSVAPGSTIEIGDAVYQLQQLQFHAPSEHTIAGEHYPLEVQLVHKNAAGKLAVISVLYDTGAESRSLGAIWSAWPHKPGLAGKLAKLDPASLLPDTRTVFRYTGSLTTPPCTEGVVWNVMRRTVSDSRAHLDAFAARYAHNARELQALNDRKIE